MRLRRFAIAALVLSALFGAALSVSAQAVSPTGGNATPGLLIKPNLEIPIPGVNFSEAVRENGNITIPYLAQYIGGIYSFLIAIVGVVAAVMMIIGGFQYLTSAGDKTRIAAGKKRIYDALIGMVLAFGSYALLYTLNPALVQFQGLSLTGVTTDQYAGMYTPAVPAEITVAPGSPTKASSGGSKQWCNWVQGNPKNSGSVDCVPVCQSWGCGTAISRTNCDYSKMPDDGPGMINPRSPDLISAADTTKWPTMAHVRVRDKSVKATQDVIEGLKRLDAYLGDPSTPYQGYSVQVNTCWRDWKGDAASECGIVLGDHNQPGQPVNHDPNAFYLAWPGSNPHSAGNACDMVLFQGDKRISADSGGEQNCVSKRAPDQTFVDIMTGPRVGARRLDFEAWHFEWNSPYGCRCTGRECDAIFPIGTSCHAIDQKYIRGNC